VDLIVLNSERYFLDFLMCLAGFSAATLGLSTTAYRGGTPYKPGSKLRLGGSISGANQDLLFDPSFILRFVIKDDIPPQLKFTVETANPHAITSAGHITLHKYSPVIEALFLSMISSYFQRHRDTIERKYGQQTQNWPAEWNFGRVVRNALAHGGDVYFNNSATAPVSWRGLTLSPADNAQKLLFGFLGPADIFALIIDMDFFL
jgi:hypothetical protein